MNQTSHSPEKKAAFAGNVCHPAQRNISGSYLIPCSWWPLLISCILVPVLCLAGGADLGAYGEKNAFRQLCVSIAWPGIPLGVLASIISGFFIVTERGRGWEAAALWFCCLVVFPVYALITIAVLTQFSA